MTNIEARGIARRYALEKGEALQGFTLGIGDEEEFTNKYYFDFTLQPLNGQMKEDISFGGPRGLTVDKNNSGIEVITHSCYTTLKEKENELAEIHQLLLDFKIGKKQLADIKAKLNLRSKQLLQVSKFIESVEFKNEKTYEVTSSIIDDLKKYL